MGLSPEVATKAAEWLQWDPNPKNKAEIEALVAAGDEPELQKRLMQRIVFGTAGLRARMQAGYSSMNDLVVTQTSQGLCKYVAAQVENAAQRGIVIGYDGRHNSLSFAHITAATFLREGFTVYLFNRLAATPLVPFGVLFKNAACGVMVTASHNPKEDNGYKVYWANGCQIIPPHDAGIAATILDNLEPWADSDASPAALAANDKCIDATDEIADAYFADISSKMCHTRADNQTIKATGKAAPLLTYSAMHGVGHPWCVRAFDCFDLAPFVKVDEQCDPDPEFSTGV
jgi:phosphomannomutase